MAWTALTRLQVRLADPQSLAKLQVGLVDPQSLDKLGPENLRNKFLELAPAILCPVFLHFIHFMTGWSHGIG